MITACKTDVAFSGVVSVFQLLCHKFASILAAVLKFSILKSVVGHYFRRADVRPTTL
jgi:hypothetical protein